MVWSNGSSRSTRMLSLCNFPFVYEPAAKSTILSLSNFNTQMGEFHDALRESISWGGGAVPFLVLRVRSWSCFNGLCQGWGLEFKSDFHLCCPTATCALGSIKPACHPKSIVPVCGAHSLSRVVAMGVDLSWPFEALALGLIYYLHPFTCRITTPIRLVLSCRVCGGMFVHFIYALIPSDIDWGLNIVLCLGAAWRASGA